MAERVPLRQVEVGFISTTDPRERIAQLEWFLGQRKNPKDEVQRCMLLLALEWDKVDPEKAAAYYRALGLKKQGDEELRKAAARYAATGKHDFAGKLYEKIGDWETAAEQYSAEERKRGTKEGSLYAATLYEKAGRLDKALLEHLKWWGDFRGNARKGAVKKLVTLMGRPQDQVLLEAATTLSRDGFHAAAGNAYEDIGRPEDALKEYESAKEWGTAAQLAEAMNDVGRAIKYWTLAGNKARIKELKSGALERERRKSASLWKKLFGEKQR